MRWLASRLITQTIIKMEINIMNEELKEIIAAFFSNPEEVYKRDHEYAEQLARERESQTN